jgi:hypothetical protein
LIAQKLKTHYAKVNIKNNSKMVRQFMAHKKACVMQSNYIPWKGYFDLIRHSDVFIFLDDVQYTKETWRNRGLVKSSIGLQWLSVPVDYKYSAVPAIQDITVANTGWSKKHLDRLSSYYRWAPFYEETMAYLKTIYEVVRGFTHLSDINHFLLRHISDKLGIETIFHTSSELLERDVLAGFSHNADRLVRLCKAVGADICLNGPSAKAYTDDDYCDAHGVKVLYADYSHYCEYPQLHGDFHHGVSIIDLLMMTGADARSYLSDRLFDF